MFQKSDQRYLSPFSRKIIFERTNFRMDSYYRKRPWAFLTQDFWEYIDLLIAELNAQSCNPPVERKSSILFLILLIVLHAPFAIAGIPIFVITKMISSTNHSFEKSEHEEPITAGDKLTIISCNMCLMPEGLARVNNLPDVPGRAEKIAKVVHDQDKIPLVRVSASKKFQKFHSGKVVAPIWFLHSD